MYEVGGLKQHNAYTNVIKIRQLIQKCKKGHTDTGSMVIYKPRVRNFETKYIPYFALFGTL
jgi:hypothetical protein